MSLFTFIEKQIKENRDLLLAQRKDADYSNLEKYFISRQKRFSIQAFTDLLFYDYICKHSQNIIEYEYLKKKTLKISQIWQRDFDITLLREKLKKEGDLNQI